MSNAVGRTIRINHRNYGNIEPICFCHRNIFLANVNDKKHIGQTVHISDAREIFHQTLVLTVKLQTLFFCQHLETTIFFHSFDVFHFLHRFLHGLKICHQTAQPAIIDIKLSATLRLFFNRVLGLTFGADK